MFPTVILRLEVVEERRRDELPLKMVSVNIFPANHVLFQLANSFLLISYVLTDLLLLRLCLSVACMFYSMCVSGLFLLPHILLFDLLRLGHLWRLCLLEADVCLSCSVMVH